METGRVADPLGLAATAVGAGMAVGLTLVTATVLGVGALRPADPAAAPDLGAPFYLLLAGTLGGLVVAGVTTWRLLLALGSTYRRGGLALVSAFATVVLMLVCIPVDRALGAPGLAVLLGLCALAALHLGRRARRAGSSA